MKLKFLAYGILGMLLINSSCKKQDNAEQSDTNSSAKNGASTSYVADNSLKIVAYFPSYRDPAGVTSTKYKLVTHMFYAFLNPDANGNLLAVPNASRFSSVIATARANGCKVGISVAGAANLKTLCTSAAKRTTLCNNLVNFVLNNNLDGLDMDWESPRNNDGTDVTYAALMSELSTKLHAQNKFLSAAITPGVYAGSIRDGIKNEVFGYVDFFNIMMYDGLGWDSAEPNQHASYNMCVASLDYWITTRGMPRENAMVGLPSYGSSSTTSTSMSYRDLLAAGASSTSNYFTTGGNQYGYTGTTLTTSKATLARNRGNGVILWEMYGDSNTESISMLKAAKNVISVLPNTVDNFESYTVNVGPPGYDNPNGGFWTTAAGYGYAGSKGLTMQDFDALNKYCNRIGFVPAASKTFEFKLRVQSYANPGGATQFILKNGSVSVFHMAVFSNGSINWYNGAWNALPGTPVPLNTWVSIKVVANSASTAAIYVDGVLIGNAGKETASATSINGFTFGSGGSAGTGDLAFFDDVRLY